MTKLYAAAFWATVLALAVVIWALHLAGGETVLRWVVGQEGAAWVQAVGSVGAILAAVWVAARQNSHQLAVEASREADRIRALAVLVEEYANAYGSAPRIFELNLKIQGGTKDPRDYPVEHRELIQHKGDISTADFCLERLAPAEASTEELARCMLAARRMCLVTRTAFQSREPMWPDNPQREAADKEMYASLTSLRRVVQQLRQEAQRLEGARG